MTGFLNPEDQPLIGASYRTRWNTAGVQTLGAPPAGANVAVINFVTAVRMTMNGVDPTAAAGGGRLVPSGSTVVLRGLASIAAARFLVTTGTIEANVEWWTNRSA